MKGMVVGWDSENFLYHIGTSPRVARLAPRWLSVWWGDGLLCVLMSFCSPSNDGKFRTNRLLVGC